MHPKFHSQGDNLSASVRLAACLDHSTEQQFRLKSGLFIFYNNIIDSCLSVLAR